MGLLSHAFPMKEMHVKASLYHSQNLRLVIHIPMQIDRITLLTFRNNLPVIKS